MYYETRKVKISTIEDSIIRVEIKEDAVLTKEDLKKHQELFNETFPDSERFYLIVMGVKSRIKWNAITEFMVSDKSALDAKEAIVINSVWHRTFHRLYLLFRRPIHPISIFSKESEGLSWLKVGKG